MPENLDAVRIDKWLWAARFFKSRAQAVLAIEAGRVQLHGERIKPARTVKVGDRVLIQREQERFELREFPHVDVEPRPLFRLDPNPLFLLKEELPGSE